MGILGDMAGAESDGGAVGSDNDTSAAGESQDVDTTSEAQTESKTEAEPKTERVALPSRRERAAQRQNEVTRQIESLTKTIGESQKQFETRMSALAEENSRLRGHLEVIGPILQRQQQPAPAPAKDPAEIKREARKALDAGDFETWDRLNTEAILLQVRPLIPQQTQQAPQQGPSPVVQAMMMQHPAVVNAGDRGIQLAIIKDQELGLMGMANGPERYKKAFEMAEAQLKPATAPSYSQQSRGALAGVPRERSAPASGGGEPGVELTAYEVSVAEACGMTKAQYAAQLAKSNPSRVRNG